MLQASSWKIVYSLDIWKKAGLDPEVFIGFFDEGRKPWVRKNPSPAIPKGTTGEGSK